MMLLLELAGKKYHAPCLEKTASGYNYGDGLLNTFNIGWQVFCPVFFSQMVLTFCFYGLSIQAFEFSITYGAITIKA